MSDFPDILGMELYDAAVLLEAEGLPFIIVETKPAKRKHCIPAEAGQLQYGTTQPSALRMWIGAQKEWADGIFRVIKVQPPAPESGGGSAANPGGQETEGSFVLTVCKYD